MISAIVPVKLWEQGKSRLSGVLDPADRAKLARAMMMRTVDILLNCGEIGDVIIVTPAGNDLPVLPDKVRRIADPDGGLNRAVEVGIAAALDVEARAALVLPIDLPLLTVAAIDGLVHDFQNLSGSLRAVIAPDRHRAGTNAMLCMPPDLIPPKFGADSFRHHLHLADSVGADVAISNDFSLGVDLDTPDDMSHLQPANFFELGLPPALQSDGAIAVARTNEG